MSEWILRLLIRWLSLLLSYRLEVEKSQIYFQMRASTETNTYTPSWYDLLRRVDVITIAPMLIITTIVLSIMLSMIMMRLAVLVEFVMKYHVIYFTKYSIYLAAMNQYSLQARRGANTQCPKLI